MKTNLQTPPAQQTTWYATKSAGNHQGVIADEQTGRTVALSYDVKDTPLLAAAPDLLNALELAIATIERLGTRHGPFSSFDGTLDVARTAIGKARGQDL